MKLLTESEDRGLRLDHYLSQHIESVTRSHIQTLNRGGAIQIDGRREKSGYRLQGRETIEIDLNRLDASPLQGEAIPLQIYYEDTDLAVIEKPAGLAVHPGAGNRSSTLVHALLHHFQSLSDLGGGGRPGIVHRLDKRTSGLLVVAKNNAAHAKLGKMFHDREVQKRYIALVHGKVAQQSRSIELPIGRDPAARTRMTTRKGRGRSASTEYQVIEMLREFSVLDVLIKTGRTHQIRVHLSAIDHPVVGDNVYGETRYRDFIKKFGPLDRYFLHAAYLRFAHPTTGVLLEFHSPLPSELQELLHRIRT